MQNPLHEIDIRDSGLGVEEVVRLESDPRYQVGGDLGAERLFDSRQVLDDELQIGEVLRKCYCFVTRRAADLGNEYRVSLQRGIGGSY
jgi:hypothetical protein